MREENNNLIHENKYISIMEIKPEHLDKPNDKMIRLYCSQWDSVNPSFNLQIRTFDGIGEYSSGKKRNMVATASVTLDELREMVAFAERQMNGNK